MVCLRIMKWDMAKENRDHGRETAGGLFYCKNMVEGARDTT